MSKRYLVFAFEEYYPSGGMCDCIYKADELETVKGFVRWHRNSRQWSYDAFQVYDTLKGKVKWLEGG